MEIRRQYAKALTEAQWRWEFLRRSRHYISAWTAFAIERPLPDDDDDALTAQDFLLYRMINPCLRSYEVNVVDLQFTDHIAIFRPAGSDVVDDRLWSLIERWRYSNSLVCTLTLDVPIDRQFEQLRMLFNKHSTDENRYWQGRMAKLHPQKYPRYLRLLDARHPFGEADKRVDASWPEIVKAFEVERTDFVVDRDSIQDSYRQAQMTSECLRHKACIA